MKAGRKRARIGWREWLALPQLGVSLIKAKIDSGARSSSLHVEELNIEGSEGNQFASFFVRSGKSDSEQRIACHCPVHELREVRSSNGQVSLRPVIITSVCAGDRIWPIEVTLADRRRMVFRMLLGRTAFRGRFLVDVGRSFVAGLPAFDKDSAQPEKMSD